MPLMTRAKNITNLFDNTLFIYASLLILITIATYLWFESNNSYKFFINIFSSFKVFKASILENSISNFFTGLSILINSNLSFVISLKTAIEISDHKLIKEHGVSLQNFIDKDLSISESFRRLMFFDNMVISRIATAEKTGDYEKTFFQLAEYYQKRSDKNLEKAIKLIELSIKILVIALLILLILAIIGSSLLSVGK